MRSISAVFGALFIGLLITGPAQAQSNMGQFTGEVVAKFLRDGRNMKLERPFGFLDPKGLRWDVPAGAETDGASIPRVLWVAYPPFTGKYRAAAVIHDHYCQTKSRGWKETHEVFYHGMRAAGVEERTAKLMYAAVYHFGPRWGQGEPRTTGPGQDQSPEEQTRLLNDLKAWIETESPDLREITRRLDASGQMLRPSERRVALVIGNSAYRHTPKLDNPINDARDMATALKTLGFEVVDGFDLDKAGMDRSIRDFAGKLTGAVVGLLYYAGHGLQVDGQNYLVPIDAELTSRAALDFEMVRLDLVQRTMEREVSTNIIFLDACRDNPLARNLARTLGTRSMQIGRGLAVVESGEGTLISFSTQPGNVALDGIGRNSPYAASLSRHIAKRGDDLSSILIKVRNDVIRETQRRQVPWEHSALTDRFYFTPPPAPGPTPEQQKEIAYWNAIKDSTDDDHFRSYLNNYPQGSFAAVARILIDALDRQKIAEQAALEQERKRTEQTSKAAEVARLEELRRIEAAKLAEGLRIAHLAKNAAEAARLEQQDRAEEAMREEALRKAREEEQLAREAAKAAEAERLSAIKTAEERRKAADAEAKKADEKLRVAALPKAETQKNIGAFDGLWTISWIGVSNCSVAHGTYTVRIRGGSAAGGYGGQVSSSGAARWSRKSVTGVPVTYVGTLRGNTGSGRFQNTNNCRGTFTARRS